MNVSLETIDDAFDFVTHDAALMTALYDWYVRDKGIPGSSGIPFDGWIREKLDQMARCFEQPKACSLAKALRIGACGDALAVLESIDAKAHGFKSDVNCYVEEDVLNSSVWLKGFDAKATIDRAEDVAKRFRKAGYCAEVHVDETDAKSVTVDAQIDFNIYCGIWMSGRLTQVSSIYRTNMV